jgi:hypothetical protein
MGSGTALYGPNLLPDSVYEHMPLSTLVGLERDDGMPASHHISIRP